MITRPSLKHWIIILSYDAASLKACENCWEYNSITKKHMILDSEFIKVLGHMTNSLDYSGSLQQNLFFSSDPAPYLTLF